MIVTPLSPFRLSTRVILIACAALLATCGSGCQRRFFQANSLPPELAAPRATNISKLDLSGLARGNVRAELIYPGDTLNILMLTGLEDKSQDPTSARVGDDGNVNVPLVGFVPVAGMSLAEAEHLIQAESIRREVFRNPQVTVQLKQRRANQVTVVGAVEHPGVKELPMSSSDVLTALVAAGGISKDAGPFIEIRHPASVQTVTENVPPGTPGAVPTTDFAGFRRQRQVQVPARSQRVDLQEASRNSNTDLHLEDGSVVMVMKQPDRLVHVTGLVKKSDQFRLPIDQDIFLLDAIAMAGGRTMEIADKVHVIRKLPGREEPVVIEASVREAKRDGRSNIRLSEGDVISVEETPLTFTVGTLREFIRFGFTSALPIF